MLPNHQTQEQARIWASQPHRVARSTSHALAIALAVLGAVTLSTRGAGARQPPVTSAAQQRPVRTPHSPQPASLRLLNTSADTLRVEIRVGPSATCDEARVTDSRTLPPGRSWLIATAHPICWRQTVKEAATVAMTTAWQRRLLTPSERADVVLRAR